MMVIAHQTIRQNLDFPKRMGLTRHLENGFIVSGSAKGRLASQPTHDLIDRIRIVNTQGCRTMCAVPPYPGNRRDQA
jgi:hypothetical protein